MSVTRGGRRPSILSVCVCLTIFCAGAGALHAAVGCGVPVFGEADHVVPGQHGASWPVGYGFVQNMVQYPRKPLRLPSVPSWCR